MLLLKIYELPCHKMNSKCTNDAGGYKIRMFNLDTHKEQTLSNGKDNGHALFFNLSQSTRNELANGHLNQDNWNLLVNQVPHGVALTK